MVVHLKRAVVLETYPISDKLDEWEDNVQICQRGPILVLSSTSNISAIFQFPYTANTETGATLADILFNGTSNLAIGDTKKKDFKITKKPKKRAIVSLISPLMQNNEKEFLRMWKDKGNTCGDVMLFECARLCFERKMWKGLEFILKRRVIRFELPHLIPALLKEERFDLIHLSLEYIERFSPQDIALLVNFISVEKNRKKMEEKLKASIDVLLYDFFFILQKFFLTFFFSMLLFSLPVSKELMRMYIKKMEWEQVGFLLDYFKKGLEEIGGKKWKEGRVSHKNVAIWVGVLVEAHLSYFLEPNEERRKIISELRDLTFRYIPLMESGAKCRILAKVNKVKRPSTDSSEYAPYAILRWNLT